jgi:hypothetical protein
MNFLKGWNKTMSEILIGSTSDPNEATVLPETPEQKAKQLPDPSGYRILCAIPEIEDSYDNGLIKSELTMKHEELLTTVLFVVKMGPDCYKDKDRFPSGPWCKQGDFILVRPARRHASQDSRAGVSHYQR